MSDILRRRYEINRKTNETDIKLSLDLDGSGRCSIYTGIPFFNHMLEQFAFHSGFDLIVDGEGDTDIDCHHLVEDVGIALGVAFRECIGDKKGIKRYGSMYLPMDESLCLAVADICGRANLVYNCSFKAERVGDLETEMVEEFFKAFVSNAFVTLHINLMYGSNTHHMVECIFKAVGRAFGEAAKIVDGNRILSTKGCL